MRSVENLGMASSPCFHQSLRHAAMTIMHFKDRRIYLILFAETTDDWRKAMKPKVTVLLISLIALVPSFAFAQNRNANLEPACADSGSGTDPLRAGYVTQHFKRYHEGAAGGVPIAPCIFSGLSVDIRS
jgi:hypothetical protein